MNDNDELGLLADLVRLLRKYGPGEFERLASAIRDGQLTEQLATMLDQTAKAGRRAKVEQPPRPTKRQEMDVKMLLRPLERDDPEKAAILRELYTLLQKKAVLSSLAEVRHFAEDNGLPPVNAKSRKDAIGPFFRSLSKLSIPCLRSLASHASSGDELPGRSLEGWAEMILSSKDRRGRGSQ